MNADQGLRMVLKRAKVHCHFLELRIPNLEIDDTIEC